MRILELIIRRSPDINYWSVLPRTRINDQKNPFSFAYARTGLKYGLKALGIKSGSFILIPETICETLLHPMQQLGIEPVYYKLTEHLEPNWDHLRSKIKPNVKGLLMVHYFGQPQNIPEFKTFCEENNLLLVEDNAHGYGGKHNGQLLGTFGDIGISSPRKNFPVVNGAYLYLKNISVEFIPDLPLEPLNIPLLGIKSIIKRGLGYVSFLEKRLKKRPNYASQEEFREHVLPDWGMDRVTGVYLNSQDLDGIRIIRQKLYNIWREWAISQKLSPVFDLSPGAMPWVFPAYTKSHAESIRWFDWGFENGIDLGSWPTLPREIVKANDSAMRVWEKLICFPIHNKMNPRKLSDRLDQLSFSLQ